MSSFENAIGNLAKGYFPEVSKESSYDVTVSDAYRGSYAEIINSLNRLYGTTIGSFEDNSEMYKGLPDLLIKLLIDSDIALARLVDSVKATTPEIRQQVCSSTVLAKMIKDCDRNKLLLIINICNMIKDTKDWSILNWSETEWTFNAVHYQEGFGILFNSELFWDLKNNTLVNILERKSIEERSSSKCDWKYPIGAGCDKIFPEYERLKDKCEKAITEDLPESYFCTASPEKCGLSLSRDIGQYLIYARRMQAQLSANEITNSFWLAIELIIRFTNEDVRDILTRFCMSLFVDPDESSFITNSQSMLVCARYAYWKKDNFTLRLDCDGVSLSYHPEGFTEYSRSENIQLVDYKKFDEFTNDLCWREKLEMFTGRVIW